MKTGTTLFKSHRSRITNRYTRTKYLGAARQKKNKKQKIQKILSQNFYNRPKYIII